MKSKGNILSIFFGCLSLIFVLVEFFLLHNNYSPDTQYIIYIKLSVAIISILSGLHCTFMYSNDKNTRATIYLLYWLAIAFLNLYFRKIHPGFNTPFSYICFDVFGTATNICILLCIFHSYQSKYSIFMSHASIAVYFFSVVTLLKFILISIIPSWTLFHNPLKYSTHIMLCITIAGAIIQFIYLYATTSRLSTMLLRYLLISIFYAVCPTLIITVKIIIQGVYEFNSIEITSALSAFMYLPFIISCSTFQYKSERTNFIIRILITFLGYSTVTVLTLEMAFELLNPILYKSASAVIALISPFFTFLVYFVINKFLTLESSTIRKSLSNYEEAIEESKTLQEIYALTASTIESIFKCKYIFFYDLQSSPDNALPFSDASEDIIQNQLELSNKTKNKKPFQIFDDGSICKIYFTDKEPAFKIFIGPKENNDKYLPSELALFNRYLQKMYNKVITEYSKVISTELETVSHTSKILTKEIQLAAYVQQSFYPQEIGKINGWEYSFYAKAMAGVSGDMYDFFIDENNNLDGVGIFDVSGHGISSGLVTMLVRNIIHQEFYKNRNLPLDEVMHIIDARFRREKNNIENFMTGILMRINEDKIELVNAAHPYPIIYHKKNNEIFYLNKTNKERSTVIGFNDLDAIFLTTEITLDHGDEIILYTDGINEAVDAKRNQFGLPRLFDIASQNISLSVQEQSDKILEELKKFTGEAPANDDITMIILRRE